ncbi:MAG: Fe-S cluster assembly protein SufD [candidate division NC10 bacterium RBG_16_65_8]|nr:MAG: Fe-S cluster assembly protein SufD [candidate division NC10 bacterium RBG_16_65_8]
MEGQWSKKGQAWFQPVRQAAIARLADIGFPTTHDEDWRFTSLTPVVATEFQIAGDATAGVDIGSLAPFAFAGCDCPRLVFVNGRFALRLSTLSKLPAGVRAGSLAQALAADRGALEPHLARYEDFQHEAFSALNTAFLADGAFVSVPRGTVVEAPIHVLYVTVPGGVPIAAHPRTLVVTGDDSQVSVVEDYVSLGEGAHLSNAVTELVVGDGSVVGHTLIQRENRQAFHVSTLRAQQGRSSNLTSHTVLLGGALTRRNIHPVLAGEGAECLINGLFMANGRQHMDNYMKVEHASPHCASRQVYKGVLDGQSHGVFHGRIVVHKDAQKTDAKQTNMNLLLSEDAQIDTKPQLEIYADDVKCTHGATIGQIDDEAIFYLRSRGIPEASARALLLYAFAGDMLQRMKIEPVRRHLEQLVTQWVPQGNLLEGVR